MMSLAPPGFWAGRFGSERDRIDTMNRLTMYLRYSRKDNRWHLYAEACHLKGFDRKSDGEAAGRERGNREYIRGGEARLIVHRADGSIELQYTYARSLWHPACAIEQVPA
jgi:hypothetical protein